MDGVVVSEKRIDRKALYFDAPYKVSIREEATPGPGPGQLLVQTLVSGISAGTEMLFYRGQAPTDIPIDETIPSLAGKLEYPLRYGYAAVGRVTELGSGVSSEWKGRTVFALNPHESHFVISAENVVALPEGMLPEEAVFLPNMDTAVNFLLDGQPLTGERVVVFGQGVVGLLTTALLAQIPLAKLITLDSYPLRRGKSLDLGAHASLDPAAPDFRQSLRELLEAKGTYDGADLVFELSGNPQALDHAIAVTGFGGRVVIGSWYGNKPVQLNLGGRFHRSRIRLISSQVSTVDPRITGRWDKSRRLQVALRMIEKLTPAALITHRFSIDQAAEACELLDRHAKEAIQVVFTYQNQAANESMLAGS
jgi:2-desacetyl-2-hydroxyethyl bacteriochlorophyllide A dehydrogenase